MKNIIGILLFVSMSFLPAIAQSTELTPQAGHLIGRIDIRSSGVFDIHNEDNTGWQLPGCEGANHARVASGHLAYDQIYSMVLASKHSGSRIFFRATCQNANIINVVEAFQL